ncbi:MAG: hypothetical protein P0Y65_15575 [Candidatus Devosia phytovorans]|uniref:DUF2946 domain-containing protein n=1 Tax=Candidatus Devosia phytovorans TaxID=3121372 RepID=A0AAJ5VU21_9HYPH|nr:hypothetical protein [Devosia sp.]WEK03602.1 MAG: hypothetical protein P0Y65_15575 [Devosia sp.]
MLTTRNIGKEIGTALAVLAIYLLTMLMPLHQARASQLAFEELGYSTTTVGWVLCTPGLSTGEDSDITVAKCPATGIGKHELTLPALDRLPLGLDRIALAAAPVLVVPAFLPAPSAPPSGSRAPPALV